ncbi:MarR family transcriptional regulator [Paraburkholderia sp. C35]|uniref:MarR family winged helix-turn-helix transcriptional regulator n=1 Tax=Paraburkholderia sp. C35 TaxID=2126993 RepID=UPI000D68D710|nr:MarR family transcriptional regulator [Paraburkholderia sp. C35]
MFDENLYFNSASLSRLMEREWAAAYADLDLTPPQAVALQAVLESPGFTPSKLAKVLVVGRPSASRLVDGLCKKHLVKREYRLEDRRECLLIPTKAGLALKAGLVQANKRAMRNISEKIGGDLFHAVSGCMLDIRRVL